jgi:general nucleoside transport system permease protein
VFEKEKLYSLAVKVRTIIIIIVLAVLMSGLLIYIDGKNPLEVFGILLQGSFGSIRAIANTLATSTPLIFTGLSVAVAFRAGALNIGSEGQMAIGAIVAALIGVQIEGLPPLLHVAIAFAGAGIAGGFWAAIPGVFKIRYGVSEVVGTLMANYVAILFTNYVVTYPFRYPNAPMGISPDILPSAKLSPFIPLTRFGWSFIIAVVVALFVRWMYQKTVFGRELTVVGSNSRFAQYIGVEPKPKFLWAMTISGALAGLGGAVLVLGVQYRFVQDITANMGFDGIPIALIASNNPIGVLFVSIAFGALRVGGMKIEGIAGVPFELTQVMQALIILFLAGSIAMKMSTKKRVAIRE